MRILKNKKSELTVPIRNPSTKKEKTIYIFGIPIIVVSDK